MKKVLIFSVLLGFLLTPYSQAGFKVGTAVTVEGLTGSLSAVIVEASFEDKISVQFSDGRIENVPVGSVQRASQNSDGPSAHYIPGSAPSSAGADIDDSETVEVSTIQENLSSGSGDTSSPHSNNEVQSFTQQLRSTKGTSAPLILDKSFLRQISNFTSFMVEVNWAETLEFAKAGAEVSSYFVTGVCLLNFNYQSTAGDQGSTVILMDLGRQLLKSVPAAATVGFIFGGLTSLNEHVNLSKISKWTKIRICPPVRSKIVSLEIDENEFCPICLESFTETAAAKSNVLLYIAKSPCGKHAFCLTCFESLFLRPDTRKCPFCMFPFPSDLQFVELYQPKARSIPAVCPQ
jgi:hypothetical protein